jgi:hypothetical protein
MTDTTRESLERYAEPDKSGVLWKDPDGLWVKHSDYAALLTRAEAVEAERDAAMTEALSLAKTLHANHYSDVPQWEPFDYPAGVISQIDNMVAGIIERAKAERDALQAKLAVAVEAGEYLLRAFDAINDRPHRYRADDVFLMVKNGSRIASVYDARAALATLTADTPPDPRIEGWNAAIEAAAEIAKRYHTKANERIKTDPKDADRHEECAATAGSIRHAICLMSCPYTPKEGKENG